MPVGQKITESQYRAACNVAGHVFDQHLKQPEGIDLLARDHGLNRTSARDFIDDYAHLMRGEVFKRAMSAKAMEHFLGEIFLKRERHHHTNAVAALNAHITYYEGHYKTHMTAMRGVADAHVSLLTNTSALAEVEAAFAVAVQRSLRDSAAARTERLAAADPMPARMVVQATVYMRNPDVVAAALVRAAGACETCRRPAPFRRRKDRTPYLEVHHRKPLADGGKDTLDNAVALCPNCHRQAHHG